LVCNASHNAQITCARQGDDMAIRRSRFRSRVREMQENSSTGRLPVRRQVIGLFTKPLPSRAIKFKGKPSSPFDSRSGNMLSPACGWPTLHPPPADEPRIIRKYNPPHTDPGSARLPVKTRALYRTPFTSIQDTWRGAVRSDRRCPGKLLFPGAALSPG